MKNLTCKLWCLIALCLLLGQLSAQTVNNLCVNAEPFCADSVSFPAGTSATETLDLPMGQRGCLYYTPAPTWFVLKVDNPGDLQIIMRHVNNRDIDFACWGPFRGYATRSELLEAVCTSQLYGTSSNTGTLVDCSYSAASVETCDIPNAQTDDWYILLICNYSRDGADIIFTVQPGTVTLNCNAFVDARNNGPIFEGNTLQMFADIQSENGYQWTGPNGFTSTERNPIIPNATTAATGDYSVTYRPVGATEDVTATTHAIVYSPISINILAPIIFNEDFEFPHP